MTEKFELQMMDNLIKMHKRHCTIFLGVIVLSLSVLIMNIATLVIYKNLSLIAALCSGILISNMLYALMEFFNERLSLRLERERKAIYEKFDVEERLELRQIGSLLSMENGGQGE